MATRYVLIEDATVVRSTDKAGLFRIDGEEYWIPWSQVRDDSVDRDGATGNLWITEWIAGEKGLEGQEDEE
jgi:hypothetical protein